MTEILFVEFEQNTQYFSCFHEGSTSDDANFNHWVKSNKFRILNFSNPGLEDVLYVPAKEQMSFFNF